MVACPATPPLTNNQWREIGGMARTSKGEIAALPMAYSVLVGGHITPKITEVNRNLTRFPEEVVTPN
jgi:hypothetical protein